MKIIDITVDLETCALPPTAAVMTLAAVVWQRNGVDSPFYSEEIKAEDILDKNPACFFNHIDIRSMFLDGFTFDQQTAAWWASQDEAAKESLLGYDETPLLRIDVVVRNFFSWISGIKEDNGADTVYLWSQGSDFDIAILRNICYKYGIEIPIGYHNFRDHRTFFMEGARLICEAGGTEFNQDQAYKLVDDYSEIEPGVKHDPVYDCKCSIYSTWQMMKHLRSLIGIKI